MSNKEANSEIFRQVAEAYEILSDATRRSEYDAYRDHFKSKKTSNSRPHQQPNNNPGHNDYTMNDIFQDIFSSFR